jgi:hypothetical protein
MSKYYIPLTEQEELSLRQLATQPGFEVLFKLLQMLSLDAQSEAMDCTEGDAKKRLLVLSDAQATVRVVSNLTKKLIGYQNQMQQQILSEVEEEAIINNIWNERTN